MKKRVPVGLVLGVHLVAVTLTWRDLNRRTAAEVLGSKRIWQVASGANTLGSVAYWLFGRKARANGARLASVSSPGESDGYA